MVKGGGGAAASSSPSSAPAAAAAAAAAMDASVSRSQQSQGPGPGQPPAQQGEAAAGSTSKAARDAWYTFDEAKLEEVMSAKAWIQE